MIKTNILLDYEDATVLVALDDISEANIIEKISELRPNATDIICHFDEDYNVIGVDLFEFGGLTHEYHIEKIPYYAD